MAIAIEFLFIPHCFFPVVCEYYHFRIFILKVCEVVQYGFIAGNIEPWNCSSYGRNFSC